MKKYLLITFPLFFLSQHLSQAQNFPSTEWEKIQSPTFYGWDETKLNTIEEYIIDSTATTGLMIIQNGKVIYQFGNVSENSYIASCRKSILAMLYGKYVENGTIQLDQSLEDLNISYEGLLSRTEQKATVKDIISSRSGIYLPAANGGDMTQLAPPRGTVKPGELWLYNNWDFNMAGHIFEKLTHQNIYDDIEAQFAIPLQMQDWDRASQEKSGDAVITDVMAYHINFSTRDMARLGLLMLHNGKWNHQQIIPESWVAEMTKPSTSFEELDKIAPFVKNKFSQFAYGYMWWLWDQPNNSALENAYSAQGALGQNITVIPKINTVIAIKTNDLYSRQKGDHSFMIDQIAHAYSPALKEKLHPLAESITQNDMEQFVKDYNQAPPTADTIDFQNLVNSLGYYYLNDLKDFEKALTLFTLNVAQHPASWLVYDGLAEAYFLSGNMEESLINYQKTISLNPENEWNNNERVEYILERIRGRE